LQVAEPGLVFAEVAIPVDQDVATVDTRCVSSRDRELVAIQQVALLSNAGLDHLVSGPVTIT